MTWFLHTKSSGSCKNGIYHHRSHYILQSTMEASPKEFLVPFVKECIKFEKKATETNFQKFLENLKDENYIFIYHVTFSYLLGFHLYTESVCKNHSSRMLEARIQIDPLFYSFFIQNTSSFIYETYFSGYKCLRN